MMTTRILTRHQSHWKSHRGVTVSNKPDTSLYGPLLYNIESICFVWHSLSRERVDYAQIPQVCAVCQMGIPRFCCISRICHAGIQLPQAARYTKRVAIACMACAIGVMSDSASSLFCNIGQPCVAQVQSSTNTMAKGFANIPEAVHCASVGQAAVRPPAADGVPADQAVVTISKDKLQARQATMVCNLHV